MRSGRLVYFSGHCHLVVCWFSAARACFSLGCAIIELDLDSGLPTLTDPRSNWISPVNKTSEIERSGAGDERIVEGDKHGTISEATR